MIPAMVARGNFKERGRGEEDEGGRPGGEGGSTCRQEFCGRHRHHETIRGWWIGLLELQQIDKWAGISRSGLEGLVERAVRSGTLRLQCIDANRVTKLQQIGRQQNLNRKSQQILRKLTSGKQRFKTVPKWQGLQD